VIHDLWTLLQEMISYVFKMETVRIDMGHILNGYEVRVLFVFLIYRKLPPVNRASQETPRDFEPAGTETIGGI